MRQTIAIVTANPPVRKAKIPPPRVAPAAAAVEPSEAATVDDTAWPAKMSPTGIKQSHSAAPRRKPRENTLETDFAPFRKRNAESTQPPAKVIKTKAGEGSTYLRRAIAD